MNIFKRRHFKYDIIVWAVRWYCKYGISYRDLEEMLSERGVEVDHCTIYRWVGSIQRTIGVKLSLKVLKNVSNGCFFSF
jgi:transposase-like protein